MRRLMAIIIAAFLLFAACTAVCERGIRLELKQEEWTWSAGEAATFSGVLYPGSMDLAGTKLEIQLETEPQNADTGRCIFTSFGGKKIKIRNQSDTYELDHTGNTDALSFTGTWILPENGSFEGTTLTVALVSAEEEKLASAELISRNESWYDSGVRRPYRLPVDLNQLVWILGAACVTVWASAVIRIFLLKKKVG